MPKRKMKKNNIKVLYIAAFMIVLFAIVINLLVSHNDSEKPVSEQTPEEVAETIDQNILLNLQNMNERERMEYYFRMFLECVENEEYDEAYDLLYEEFRNSYFPTQKQFEEYISGIFTEMTDIEFYNIERNGDVYVLWIYITDAINGMPNDKQEMNIVIQEYDYNNFVMSFSVI